MPIRCFIVLLPLLLAYGCASPSRSELDNEIRRLCAIDGGVRVYETVTLTAEKFDAYGNIRTPAKEYAKPQDEFYYESDTHYYRQGNPEMWRTEYRIVRVRDKKVLGTSTVYTRRGGDFPSPMHDSSFSCPTLGSQPSLGKSIFVKGD